jgi:hypothetical protein
MTLPPHVVDMIDLWEVKMSFRNSQEVTSKQGLNLGCF